MDAELLFSLADELAQLWRSSRPSSAGLRQIARRLLLATFDVDGFADLLVKKSQSVDDSPAAIGVLRESLTTAHVVSWATACFVELQPRAEELVVAALLVDAACCRPQQRALRTQTRTDGPAHVAIGAAFAAGIIDLPTSVSQRVARHH